MSPRRAFQLRKRELLAPYVETAPTPASCTDPTVENVLEVLGGSDDAQFSGSTDTAASGSLAAALSGSSIFFSTGTAAFFVAASFASCSGCFAAGAEASGTDSDR